MLQENIKASLADKERELAKICVTAMSGDILNEVDNLIDCLINVCISNVLVNVDLRLLDVL